MRRKLWNAFLVVWLVSLPITLTSAMASWWLVLIISGGISALGMIVFEETWITWSRDGE